MKNMLPRALLCASTIAATVVVSAAHAAPIEVRLSGVNNTDGKVVVAVCDKASFLKKCAYQVSSVPGKEQTTLRLPDIPSGMWAVVAYHDENNNEKFDRNLLGMPSEQYGFSRNAASRFGPPSFNDVAIPVGDAPVMVEIRLR
jgi:uncharacterized protein (DUF2141 family)